MEILVGKHEELANLREPVATLQRDLLSYNEALAATVGMVRGGELKGPRYDVQVKDWAARGALLVKDAATVESLCFNSGEANTAATMAAVESAKTRALLLFGVGTLFCLLLTLCSNSESAAFWKVSLRLALARDPMPVPRRSHLWLSRPVWLLL